MAGCTCTEWHKAVMVEVESRMPPMSKCLLWNMCQQNFRWQIQIQEIYCIQYLYYIYIYMDCILLVSHHFSLDLLQTHPPGNDHISHHRLKSAFKRGYVSSQQGKMLGEKVCSKDILPSGGEWWGFTHGFLSRKRITKKRQIQIWLVVSTHLKNIGQKWVHLPQIGLKIKKYFKFHHQEMSPLKKMDQQKSYWSESLMYSGYWAQVTTLPKTHSSHLPGSRAFQKERRKYSNHRFSGASC